GRLATRSFLKSLPLRGYICSFNFIFTLPAISQIDVR
ncbi:MAG: hypothetical protein ACI8T1_003776, partial [Verrucomicrobiales bacterium]